MAGELKPEQSEVEDTTDERRLAMAVAVAVGSGRGMVRECRSLGIGRGGTKGGVDR